MEQFPAKNPNPVLSIKKGGTVLNSNAASEPLLYEWGVGIGEKLPFYIGDFVKRVFSRNSVEKMEIKVGKRVYLLSFHPLPEEECVNIYGFDISEQKEYEEKLRESEEKYRKIVETANEGICVTDAETIITYINDRMAEMLGYSHEEMIGRLGTDFVDEKDNAIAKLNLEKRVQGIDDTHEFKYIRKDGSHLWALVSSKSLFDEDGKFTGSLNMLTDITERKRLEEQTRLQADELAIVMEMAPVAIWIGHDPQSQNITGNRMANEFYEAEVRENVSASATPVRRFFCKGRELTADELPMQEATLKDIDVCNVELDVLLPSGKRRVILGSASPLHDADGSVRGSIGAFSDITERKQVEQALRESEKRYRTLFDKSMDAIILTDPRGVGIVLSINPAACRMLGWTEEELIGKGLDAIFDIEDSALFTQVDKNMLSGSAMSQLNYKRKDGTTLTGEVSSTFFVDHKGEPRMVNIIRDITERKQAEEALFQSEQHYRLLFETMLQGVVYQDANGKIISMNPAAERILGKTTAEFLGSSSEGEERARYYPRGRLAVPGPGASVNGIPADRAGSAGRGDGGLQPQGELLPLDQHQRCANHPAWRRQALRGIHSFQ